MNYNYCLAMTSESRHSPLQNFLIIGIFLCLFVAGYSLLRYPAILIPLRSGILFVSIFGLTLLSYSFITWRLSFNSETEAAWIARTSLGWGILISFFWFVEIVIGNLSNTRKTTFQVLYFGASGVALILPIIAGAWGANHSGKLRTGRLVGLYSGMVSGLLTFLILMVITYLFLNSFLQDTQNIIQFHESGIVDLTAFVIGDSLAGALGHLVIGLVLGTLLGAIGGAIGKVFSNGPRNE